MIKVLFVDDEPAVLEGLENRLRRFRKKWTLSFAVGAQQALQTLSEQSHDVVVTDMRMPQIDGAELLRIVRDQHPRTTRIVLSGQTSKDGMLRALPVAHQVLTKPCKIEHLQQAIERGRSLSDRLNDDAVIRVVEGIERLPVMSDLYRALAQSLEDPNVSIPFLASLIEKDIAMTARVLQMVNSAFFGLERTVTSVDEATSYLGINLIRSLVLSLEVFSAFDDRPVIEGFCLAHLQQHSLRTARVAHGLVIDEDARWTAFSSAMLHDVGLLALATAHPQFYRDVTGLKAAEGITLQQAETKVHGISHAEVGAHLLSTWGLPYPIVEAVAHHHTPYRSGELTLGVVGAVHIAGELLDIDDSQPLSITDLESFQGLDTQYLNSTECEGWLDRWRSAVNAAAGRD